MSGIDIIKNFLESSPFVQHLGIRLERIENDEAELVLPFAQSVVTIGEMVHGGAIGALIDTAAMAASWATDAPPDNMRGTTVGLTVSYLAPGLAEDLHGAARVLRRGKQLCAVDVSVSGARSGLVAKGLVTYKLG
jgi:uncharacterized protein (TIGR00369 family)